MADLNQIKVAVLVTDGFEESELTEPVRALQDAGAEVHVLAPESGEVQAFRHHDKSIRIPVDRKLEDARPDEYDALMLPGGAFNADKLRMEDQAREFVRSFDRDEKPIAAICHAPWLLASSGVLEGRKITSYHTIQDDMKNAGATWVDEKVVVDRNWVTSRSPGDLEAFNREMLNLFGQRRRQAA